MFQRRYVAGKPDDFMPVCLAGNNRKRRFRHCQRLCKQPDDCLIGLAFFRNGSDRDAQHRAGRSVRREALDAVPRRFWRHFQRKRDKIAA